MDISFIIPIYNQEKEIRYLCDALEHIAKNMSLKCEILLCDDASRDGSTELIKEISFRYGMVKGIFHRKHEGFGRTFRDLISESCGTIVVYLDAGLPFDLDSFSSILDKIRDFDILVASRFIDPNTSKNIKLRPIFSIYRFLCSVFLNNNVKDLESAMVFLRREKILDLNLKAKEKAIFPELYAVALKKNLFIKEIPVSLRIKRQSPHPRIMFKDILDILQI
ncbi:MAG: glycosyltransferase [Candidatus Omnitrophica bacterium]|nr:glycosyltransferase [Candidatus Omnitrophota bacterium]